MAYIEERRDLGTSLKTKSRHDGTTSTSRDTKIIFHFTKHHFIGGETVLITTIMVVEWSEDAGCGDSELHRALSALPQRLPRL